MNYLHILDHKKPNRPNLKFIKEIDAHNGILYEAELVLPSDWQNVRHVTGSIYYAWDCDPLLGCLYVATWDVEYPAHDN